jgi:hypothetical protein
MGVLAVTPLPCGGGASPWHGARPGGRRLHGGAAFRSLHPLDPSGPASSDVDRPRQDGSAFYAATFVLFVIAWLMWVTGAWLSWCVLRWRQP